MLELLDKGDLAAALVKYAFGSEENAPGGDAQKFLADGAFEKEFKPALVNALKYIVTKPGVRTAVIVREGGGEHSHTVFFYLDDDYVAVEGEDKKKDMKWSRKIADGKWMLSNDE